MNAPENQSANAGTGEATEPNKPPAKRAIPELSVDVQVLISRLEKLAPNEIVSYAELNELIRDDVQNGARYKLASARRIMLHKHQRVIESVTGHGVKRLDDMSAAAIGGGVIKHIHRASRTGMKKIICADTANLDNETKILQNTHLSMLGCLFQVTKPKKIKLLEERCKEASDKLPLAKTLAVFTVNKV